MQVAAVYFAEATACGLMTLNTLRPSKVLAVLRSELPTAPAELPLLSPLRQAWSTLVRAVGRVCWVLYPALVAIILANSSDPRWFRTLTSITILFVGAIALVRLSWGGAMFGLLYGRVVRSRPELGIAPQPLASTIIGGGVTAATLVLGIVTLLLHA